ncbi:unnamed protein product [Amoebophrya sp. A120]|nr:unnamed protein product [Amoebophrya sp. A120]|eukprot:GSA120T00000012001.1
MQGANFCFCSHVEVDTLHDGEAKDFGGNTTRSEPLQSVMNDSDFELSFVFLREQIDCLLPPGRSSSNQK